MDFPIRRHQKPAEWKQWTHRHRHPVKVMIEANRKAGQLQLMLVAGHCMSHQYWISVCLSVVSQENYCQRQASEQKIEQRSGREAYAEEYGGDQEHARWSDKKSHSECGAGEQCPAIVPSRAQ